MMILRNVANFHTADNLRLPDVCGEMSGCNQTDCRKLAIRQPQAIRSKCNILSNLSLIVDSEDKEKPDCRVVDNFTIEEMWNDVMGPCHAWLLWCCGAVAGNNSQHQQQLHSRSPTRGGNIIILPALYSRSCIVTSVHIDLKLVLIIDAYLYLSYVCSETRSQHKNCRSFAQAQARSL